MTNAYILGKKGKIKVYRKVIIPTKRQLRRMMIEKLNKIFSFE